MPAIDPSQAYDVARGLSGRLVRDPLSRDSRRGLCGGPRSLACPTRGRRPVSGRLCRAAILPLGATRELGPQPRAVARLGTPRQERRSLFAENQRRGTPMRRILSIAALAVASALTLTISTSPASADRYCLQGVIWGYPGNCQFATYAQCMATASGTNAYCGINPRYAFARQRRGSHY
jgi:hypothetical protein